MGPVNVGDSFQFGFNTGYTSGPFNSADLAPMIEAAGYSYNTQSYLVSGYLNPFVTIEGNANVYWDSGVDFCNGILQILQQNGIPVDVASIQCRTFGTGGGSNLQLQGTPYPTSNQSQSVPQAPGGGCSWSQQSPTDWLACELGINPTTALIIGGVVGASLLLIILKR